MRVFLLFLVGVSLQLCSSLANAAACCGGGLPVPALILGDERANFSSSVTLSEIRTDVSANGIWKDRDRKENAETLRLNAAHIFKDRYQYGASLPILRRERVNNDTGLGDVALNAGYEFLTDWDYHPIRPKGVGFLQLVLPTGKSIQEADTLDQVDSRGRGFWALGVGSAFTKVRGKFDAIALFDVHRSFNKNGASSSAGKIDLKPGWGGTASAGAGYTLGDFRLGGAASWIYEDAVEVSGAVESRGDVVRWAVATLSAVYSPNDDWTASFSYSDQTWLGSPTNTALARSVQFNVQKRWAR
jgi:hypothetical protein